MKSNNSLSCLGNITLNCGNSTTQANSKVLYCLPLDIKALCNDTMGKYNAYNSSTNNCTVLNTSFFCNISLPSTQNDTRVKNFSEKMTSLDIQEIIAICSVYAIIFLISVVGNSLVIDVIRKNNYLKTLTNFYIVNMAVCDLAITFLSMIPTWLNGIGVWDGSWRITGTFGMASCKIYVYLQSLPVNACVLTLTAIAFDKFFAIVYPFHHQQSSRVCYLAITLTWVITMVVVSPLLYAMKLTELNGKLYCWEIWEPLFESETAGKTLTIILFASFYALPLSIVAVLYGRIGIHLWRNRSVPGAQTGTKQRGSITAELNRTRAIKMCVILVVAFALCWLPFYVIQYLLFFSKIDLPWHIKSRGFYYAFLVGHLNCALNPCLYALLSRNFQRGLKMSFKTLRCVPRRTILKQQFKKSQGPVTLTSFESHSALDIKALTEGFTCPSRDINQPPNYVSRSISTINNQSDRPSQIDENIVSGYELGTINGNFKEDVTLNLQSALEELRFSMPVSSLSEEQNKEQK